MNILGFNCGHYGSVAVVKDGVFTAFIANERIFQIKNLHGISRVAIDYALKTAGLTLADIHAVAINNYVWQLEDERRREKFILLAPDGQEWSQDIRDFVPGETHKPCTFVIDNYEIPAYYVQHHIAHAASSYYLSEFPEAALFTVDASDTWKGKPFLDEKITPLANSLFGVAREGKLEFLECPDCLIGNFYTKISNAIGFPPLEGASKVMGLSSYGKPVYYKGLHQGLPDYGAKRFWTEDCGEDLNHLYDPAECHNAKVENIAASIQKILEETMVHYAQKLYDKTRLDYLCLAGGTALNCVANKKILERTPFKKIFVPPPATDDGTAAGAALFVHHNVLGGTRQKQNRRAMMYGGIRYTESAVKKVLAKTTGITVTEAQSENELVSETARLLSEGKIIGWYQENCEIGPRALGHRSILADPRRAEMKDIINAKVKFREGFRPFAPSVLAEHAGEYFDIGVESPFMLMTADCKQPGKIPAAIHVDGTGRLQTLTREDNGIFYDLVAAFYKITGVPVLLNTSFNIKGMPIVEMPQDAMDCFLKTKLDFLVMGRLIVGKTDMF